MGAMRIALDVSASLDGPSGLEYYIESLTSALAKAAPEREFLLYSPFWSSPRRLEEARLPRARNVTRVRLAAPQRLLLPAEEAAGLLWRERRLRALGVDAVHGLSNTLPPLSRLPGIVTVHQAGGAPPGLWSRFFFGLLPERSARRADRVIAVSNLTREKAIATYRLDPARVVTVHFGGPDPAFRPGTDAPAAGVPYVLHVGALAPHKNVPALMRAFARIVAKDPGRPLRLVLVGRPGAASDEVARLAAEAPIAGRVDVLGMLPREKIVELYQGAAAVAIPSLQEGFCFPVLEAMACGAPVVVADSSAMPEVAGDAALTCDASRPEELERALSRVLDEPELAADLRRRGAARALSFSWEKAARETLAVIDAACAARRKS